MTSIIKRLLPVTTSLYPPSLHQRDGNISENISYKNLSCDIERINGHETCQCRRVGGIELAEYLFNALMTNKWGIVLSLSLTLILMFYVSLKLIISW